MMTLHRVPEPSASPPTPTQTPSSFSSSSSAAPAAATAIILQLASEKTEYWGDEAREWRGFLVCTACRGCGAFQTPMLLLLLLPPPSPLLSTLSLSHSLSVCRSVCLSFCLSVCLSVLVVRRTWQLASLGCLPPLRVQYVQSTLCQLFIFFSLSSHSVSVLPPHCFSFFFFFFLISA